MAIVEIPTNTTALFWDQVTTLDGTPYRLTFRYNSREAAYYLQIESPDGVTTYAQGIKLVANFPLLQSYATPPGELMVVSTDPKQDQPPALGELGTLQRCTLLYAEAVDIYAGEGWRNPLFLIVPVYVAITTSPAAGAPIDAIKAAVATAVTGATGTVSVSAIEAAISTAVPGVSIASLYLGLTSPPGGTTDLTLPPTSPPRVEMANLAGCTVNGQ